MQNEKDHRQEFGRFLKQMLNKYYLYWETSSTERSPELPNAETLQAWTEKNQHPQAKRFDEFLIQSQFPPDVKQQLATVYQQLPRRRRLSKNQNEVQNQDQLNEQTETLSIPQNEQQLENPDDTVASSEIQISPPKSRLRSPVLIGISLILIAMCIFAIVVYYANRRNTKMWCTSNAAEVQMHNGVPSLYFDGTLPLENYDIRKYYIYFDESEYVSSDILSNLKLDIQRNIWIWTISDEWIQRNSEWQNTLLWHIDYECQDFN